MTPEERLLADAQIYVDSATAMRTGADALARLPVALADLDNTQTALVAEQTANERLTGQLSSAEQTIVGQADTIAALEARIEELEQGTTDPPPDPDPDPGPDPLPVQAASSAVALRDAFGMNTHFTYLGASLAWHNTDAVVAALMRLGVRKIRQRVTTTKQGRDALKRALNPFTAAGGRLFLTIFGPGDGATLDAARTFVNGQLDWIAGNLDVDAVDYLAGPNEPNADGAGWELRARACQQALYEETRKRAAFNHVKILTPPPNMLPGVEQDIQLLGDLSQWADVVDVHAYPACNDPEWRAQYTVDTVGQLAPGKPAVISEGGYFNATPEDGKVYTGGSYPTPESVTALYAPKQLLTHFVAGRDFFAYELLDDPQPYANTDKGTRESTFGYVGIGTSDPGTWHDKAQFVAMQRLLKLLEDEPHTPEGLGYRLEGPSDLRTLLLHKADGKWLLCLWRAVDLYAWDNRAHTGRVLHAGNAQVAVTFDDTTPVTVFEPSTQEASVDSFSAATFTQTVADGLVILQIG